MQICRRIHSQFSSGTEPSPTPGALTAPGSLQKCGYRIFLEICESMRHHCNLAISPLMIHLFHISLWNALIWILTLYCVTSFWVVQYPGVMSCPEEGVCCAYRGCQRDRTKIRQRLRAAAAALQVMLLFTAAVSIWLLTAPSLTTRGHTWTRIYPHSVCSVLWRFFKSKIFQDFLT